MERNAKYLEWLRQEANKYQGKIALLVLYGSTVTNTETPLSDVDCYFVPKTDEGLSLAETAIIEGIGYDVFPMSWQRLEAIAQLKSNLTPLLGQCQILYADTLEDLDRFLALQRKLKRNLSNSKFVLKAAQSKFAQALDYRKEFLKAESLGRQRRWVGLIINTLADAFVYLNKSYFKRGLKQQLVDLAKLKDLPSGFIENYRKVIWAEDSLSLEEGLTELFRLAATRIYPEGLKEDFDSPEIALEEKPQKKLSFVDAEIALPVDIERQKNFLSWYEESVSLFNKIYEAGQLEDAYLAFIGGVYLELNFVQDLSLEFSWPEADLLEFYNPRDLKPLLEATKRLQQKLVSLAAQSEIPLNEYISMDDLLKAKGIILPKPIEFKETTHLADEEIFLRLNTTAQLNEEKGYVPAYYFQIVRLRDGLVIGQCDLRVGYNASVDLGGNIGYSVFEPFRGRGTAARACKLLMLLAKEHEMKELLITVRPDNTPSIKTCLNVGAVLTKEIVIPPHHELARTSRTMNQYKLSLDID